MVIKEAAFALRNLKRNKVLATINVFGLSVGISACLVIFLVARYELSFDRFQKDGDRIFRIYTTSSGVRESSYSGIPTAAAAAIKEHFTGLESRVHFHTAQWHVKIPTPASLKDKGKCDKIIVAGPGYFDVFNYYEWLVGDPQSLTEPFSVAISESRAKIYFGDVDPFSVIGREIHYNDSLLVTVSGVFKDVSHKTDLDFSEVVSFSTIEKSWLRNFFRQDQWNSISTNSQMFIKLHPDTPVESIKAQLDRIPEIYKAEFNKTEWNYPLHLQKFEDLHFNTQLGIFDHSRPVMEKSTMQVLIVIASLILLIACINFINLETAQASRRAKEVGIRKVLGSPRSKLIRRFLCESFILCFFAVGLSCIWADLAMGFFSEYIPPGLGLDLGQPVVVLFLLSCIVIVGLLAGLYPAFVLSSYQPATALKNVSTLSGGTTRTSFIRKALTVFQFSSSQVLIVGTLTIAFQLSYMMNKDLGFDYKAVIWVSTPWGDPNDRRTALKGELEQIPEVEGLTINDMPPVAWGNVTFRLPFDNGKNETEYSFNVRSGDTSYIHVYDIKLLAGRNLVPIDTVREFLINETFARKLGFDNPAEVVGQTLGRRFTIVGVVQDFHTQSLHVPIEPTAISYDKKDTGFAIKVFTPHDRVSDVAKGLEKIKASWKKVYPEKEFQFSFLDERLKRFYETEQRTAKLARAATIIAIVISCLGLFGLSSFAVVQRTKEIGIRKVLGATVNGIWMLLSKEFMVLVLLACVISTPIAYYVSESWLDRFAYRMDLTARIYVASAAVCLLVAFSVTSLRTRRAAQSDPAESLRYE